MKAAVFFIIVMVLFSCEESKTNPVEYPQYLTAHISGNRVTYNESGVIDSINFEGADEVLPFVVEFGQLMYPDSFIITHPDSAYVRFGQFTDSPGADFATIRDLVITESHDTVYFSTAQTGYVMFAMNGDRLHFSGKGYFYSFTDEYGGTIGQNTGDQTRFNFPASWVSVDTARLWRYDITYY